MKMIESQYRTMVTWAGLMMAATPALLFISPSSVFAQSATVGAQIQKEEQKDETIVLSRFIVSADSDVGYLAANTLAGTRFNTSLFETPAAISVLTKELLNDIGAENVRDFLKFATNAGQDDTFNNVGQGTQNSDVQVKIRGFAGSTMTRDYFSWGGGVSSDRFNTERVDLNRGPNAVLYGLGGPGGVINISTKQATINAKQREISMTVGSFSKTRGEIDYAMPLVKDKLALRVNGMQEDRKGWREFEFVKSKAAALALNFKPFRQTSLRATWETFNTDQHIPWQYPAQDFGGTRWQAAGSKVSSDVLPGTNPDTTTLSLANIYSTLYAPQLRAQAFRLSSAGPDMRPDVAGTQSAGFWQTNNGPVSVLGGRADDPFFGTVIPKKASLMGEGSRVPQKYEVGSVYLEQHIGKLSVELAYNHFERERKGYFLTTGLGLKADPNSVLPGAYYADGSWDARAAAGNQSPGTLLPNIGVANPYVGQLYVEGTAQYTQINNKIDSMRATLSYDLDLRKKSKWLGRHSFAFLAQSVESYSMVQNSFEYNVKANDTFRVEDSSHQVVRRTYLDFTTPGGQRGAIDPWSNPVPVSPGVDVQWVLNSAAPLTFSDVDTEMVALQSKFLNDRFIITAGYRWDKQFNDTATEGGVQVPNSLTLWSRPHDSFVGTTRQSVFRGETSTLGAFYSPFKWLGLTVNKANSVLPQSSNINILHQPFPNRSGEGEDYGVRVSLLDRRLYLNVNVFKNDDVNRATAYNSLSQLFNPSLNQIVTTQKLLGQPLPQVMRDAGTTDLLWTGSERDTLTVAGKGFEVELAGNITKGWSVSVNYTHQTSLATNPASFANKLLLDVKGDWDNNMTRLSSNPSTTMADWIKTRDSTPNRDFALDPATFNDAYDFSAEVLKGVNTQEGRPELQGVLDQFNFFTSYRFDNKYSRLLRGTRVGIGGNFKAAPVIGFDATNNNATLRGDSYFLTNLMLGKTISLKKGRSIDFQLNVDNLFGHEDMIPFSAEKAGTVARYIYPRTYRNWNLRTTLRF